MSTKREDVLIGARTRLLLMSTANVAAVAALLCVAPTHAALPSTAPCLLPDWASQDATGEWRDGLGKAIPKPEINFAGKYFVAAHSCGAGCRYYSATDLSSGMDRDFLRMFASTDPPPVTKDGYPYITELYVRRDSAVIVATYTVSTPNGPLCRTKRFILEGLIVTPVSGTTRINCATP